MSPKKILIPKGLIQNPDDSHVIEIPASLQNRSGPFIARRRGNRLVAEELPEWNDSLSSGATTELSCTPTSCETTNQTFHTARPGRDTTYGSGRTTFYSQDPSSAYQSAISTSETPGRSIRTCYHTPLEETPSRGQLNVTGPGLSVNTTVESNIEMTDAMYANIVRETGKLSSATRRRLPRENLFGTTHDESSFALSRPRKPPGYISEKSLPSGFYTDSLYSDPYSCTDESFGDQTPSPQTQSLPQAGRVPRPRPDMSFPQRMVQRPPTPRSPPTRAELKFGQDLREDVAYEGFKPGFLSSLQPPGQNATFQQSAKGVSFARSTGSGSGSGGSSLGKLSGSPVGHQQSYTRSPPGMQQTFAGSSGSPSLGLSDSFGSSYGAPARTPVGSKTSPITREGSPPCEPCEGEPPEGGILDFPTDESYAYFSADHESTWLEETSGSAPGEEDSGFLMGAPLSKSQHGKYNILEWPSPPEGGPARRQLFATPPPLPPPLGATSPGANRIFGDFQLNRSASPGGSRSRSPCDLQQSYTQPPPAMQETFASSPGALQQSYTQPPPAMQETFARSPGALQQSYTQPPQAMQETFARSPAALQQTFAQSPRALQQTFDGSPPAVQQTFDATQNICPGAGQQSFARSQSPGSPSLGLSGSSFGSSYGAPARTPVGSKTSPITREGSPPCEPCEGEGGIHDFPTDESYAYFSADHESTWLEETSGSAPGEEDSGFLMGAPLSKSQHGKYNVLVWPSPPEGGPAKRQLFASPPPSPPPLGATSPGANRIFGDFQLNRSASPGGSRSRSPCDLQQSYTQPPPAMQETFARSPGALQRSYTQPPPAMQETFAKSPCDLQQSYTKAPSAIQESFARSPGTLQLSYTQPIPAIQETFARSPGTLQPSYTQPPSAMQETFARSPGTLQLSYAQPPPAMQETFARSPAALQQTFAQSPRALQQTFDGSTPGVQQTFDATQNICPGAAQQTFARSQSPGSPSLGLSGSSFGSSFGSSYGAPARTPVGSKTSPITREGSPPCEPCEGEGGIHDFPTDESYAYFAADHESTWLEETSGSAPGEEDSGFLMGAPLSKSQHGKYNVLVWPSPPEGGPARRQLFATPPPSPPPLGATSPGANRIFGDFQLNRSASPGGSRSRSPGAMQQTFAKSPGALQQSYTKPPSAMQETFARSPSPENEECACASDDGESVVSYTSQEVESVYEEN